MAWESNDKLSKSLNDLSQSEPFMAPAIRRIMELRLQRNIQADISDDDTQLPEFSTPEEQANYILNLLYGALDMSDKIWQKFEMDTDPDDAIKSMSEGRDLQSMVEAYLTLPDDDTDLLEDQHDEIMQQKLRFADAAIDIWLRDQMLNLYCDTQEYKIRKVLGRKAIRLTPITERSVQQWLDAGTPADELFYEGYINGVTALDGYAGVSMGDYADGSGPATDYIPVLLRDGHTGEIVQEANIEVIDPSEIRR